MESKESALASYILQTHRKQLSQLGDEEFFSLGKKKPGYLFKLPIEDSFPISSHGIPYNTMMLMSPVKDASDEALLSIIHAIEESNQEAFHFAIEMRMERVLKELLKLGVDRNRIYNRQSPLALASDQNWQKGIDLLNSSVETENQSSWCSVM